MLCCISIGVILHEVSCNLVALQTFKTPFVKMQGTALRAQGNFNMKIWEVI